MNQPSFVILMFSATGLIAGCESDKAKCDPGQVLKDAVCVAEEGGAGNVGGTSAKATGGAAVSSEGGAAADGQGGTNANSDGGVPANAGRASAGESSSAGATPAVAGGASGGEAAKGGSTSGVSTLDLFGKTCTADTDCTAPVNYCAKMPGASSGFCTQQGCKADATICPASWTCFDLAAVGVPNGPNFCQKPA